MANTSLNRLLNQLIEEMYVQKTSHGQYTMGPTLFSLGSAIINNSFSTRYGPLLQQLSFKTGLNGELYSLGPQGPILLFWIEGQSEFRVRMYPGFRLKMAEHPVMAFNKNRYPGFSCWNEPVRTILNDGTPLDDWVKIVQKENYLMEEGHVRPELGRCCAGLPEGDLVVGLSGLISEFPEDRNQLKSQVLNIISNY